MAQSMTMTEIEHEVDVMVEVMLRADDAITLALQDADDVAYYKACGIFMSAFLRIKQLRAVVEKYRKQLEAQQTLRSMDAIDAANKPGMILP